jgi:hypothetical protein
LPQELEAYLKSRNILYVSFDPSLAPVAEGITFGLPAGAVFFMTSEYGRGVSMNIKNVVISN